MGIPDHLTCLLRNVFAGFKKQQLKPDMEQRTGFKLGKDYDKGVYCHSAYLTYMQSGGGGLVTKSCLTLAIPYCSLSGSSVQGILRARILEWSAISFSRGSSWPRNWTGVSCIAGRWYPYAEYIMWNARLDEAIAGIKIDERNISDLRYADDTTLMANSVEELNNLFMKVKEASEKPGLKLSIQKLRSWHLDPSLHGK